jgi:hypothetical protein
MRGWVWCLQLPPRGPNRRQRLQGFHFSSSQMLCLGNHVLVLKQRFGFLSVILCYETFHV